MERIKKKVREIEIGCGPVAATCLIILLVLIIYFV